MRASWVCRSEERICSCVEREGEERRPAKRADVEAVEGSVVVVVLFEPVEVCGRVPRDRSADCRSDAAA